MIRSLQVAILLLIIAPTTSLASDIVIGRWCDVLVRSMNLTHTIEFTVLPNGSVVYRGTFSDGSSRDSVLEELGAETYAEVDADFGEKYRIVPSSGDLQLLDDDGLIRTARRLENVPRDGECR